MFTVARLKAQCAWPPRRVIQPHKDWNRVMLGNSPPSIHTRTTHCELFLPVVTLIVRPSSIAPFLEFMPFRLLEPRVKTLVRYSNRNKRSLFRFFFLMKCKRMVNVTSYHVYIYVHIPIEGKRKKKWRKKHRPSNCKTAKRSFLSIVRG